MVWTFSALWNGSMQTAELQHCLRFLWWDTLPGLCISLLDICSITSPHDDVIKWKHFPRYWPFVRGIHRSLVNSPHKGQWRGALMFSLICVWINGWVNNREAGDSRCYRAHYDVTVMMLWWHHWLWFSCCNYFSVLSSTYNTGCSKSVLKHETCFPTVNPLVKLVNKFSNYSHSSATTIDLPFYLTPTPAIKAPSCHHAVSIIKSHGLGPLLLTDRVKLYPRHGSVITSSIKCELK